MHVYYAHDKPNETPSHCCSQIVISAQGSRTGATYFETQI